MVKFSSSWISWFWSTGPSHIPADHEQSHWVVLMGEIAACNLLGALSFQEDSGPKFSLTEAC